jgi:hypothetical protein
VPVQFTSKWASGSTVTVNVNNPYSVPKTVTVSLRVRVDGTLVDLMSDQTQIPPATTAPVVLQAAGPVEFTADSPDPTVMVWDE